MRIPNDSLIKKSAHLTKTYTKEFKIKYNNQNTHKLNTITKTQNQNIHKRVQELRIKKKNFKNLHMRAKNLNVI